MCSKNCNTEGCCPFAFNEESEKAQNYGCLPSAWDIIHMRKVHGKTWACHEDTTKPCKGALLYMKEKGIACRIIDTDLVTLDDHWEN